MNKSNHFSGQPIFSQLIKLIPREVISSLARSNHSDRYYKKFKTYDHLITMLYAILSGCTSIREVTTGLMACGKKLNHLGMHYFPRRSTLSDANCNRNSQVFAQIYYRLYDQYAKHLPDSQSDKLFSKLYIFDATTISLFQDILKGAGKPSMNGKRKGGVKAHTLIKADEDVPCLVRLSASASPDTTFMKHVKLPEGSIVVFDKGYHSYDQLKRFTTQKISFVTRLRKGAKWRLEQEKPVDLCCQAAGVRFDRLIELGHISHQNITRIQARIIGYFDEKSNREFIFLTNNLSFDPLTIANFYQQRWQIETLFKRIKQNYPLKYFLGDNPNAIEIQIWCALIVDLLLKYVRKQAKTAWSFSNLTSMIRLLGEKNLY